MKRFTSFFRHMDLEDTLFLGVMALGLGILASSALTYYAEIAIPPLPATYVYCSHRGQ